MRDNNLMIKTKPREKQKRNQSGEDKSKNPGPKLVRVWGITSSHGLIPITLQPKVQKQKQQKEIIYYGD